MNLKEAFRYQNRLSQLMGEAERILQNDNNVLRVENTSLRSRISPEAEDETTVQRPSSEYSEQITEIISLLMFLLRERERLSYAIRAAKLAMDMDFDGEASLNSRRQTLAAIFRRMSELRSSEKLYPGEGIGYKFNAEGNQVLYHCDLKTVTTINFDRVKVRACAAALSREADRVSAELDRQTVMAQVDYEPPFDVNESFAEVLRQHSERES